MECVRHPDDHLANSGLLQMSFLHHASPNDVPLYARGVRRNAYHKIHDENTVLASVQEQIIAKVGQDCTIEHSPLYMTEQLIEHISTQILTTRR